MPRPPVPSRLPLLPFLLAASLCLVPLRAPAAELVDGIAAQVGSDVVLMSEVAALAGPLEAELRRAGATDAEIEAMRADVLERLIERKLIAQLARRAEIEATDAEIDQTIRVIAEENGLTPEQVRAQVESEGMPFEAYRQRIAEEIVHQKVLGSMVRPRVHVDEAELRALYAQRYGDQHQGGEEVHLRQILVAAPDGKPASRRKACAAVRRARAEIAGGAEFVRVAARISQVAPERGGDTGWVHREDLAPWMGPVVDSLSPGQVSDVIEAPFGCALVQLVERREMKPVSYEEARPALEAELFDQRFTEEYLRFMERLRERTYVERKGLFAEATRVGAAPASPGGAGGAAVRQP